MILWRISKYVSLDGRGGLLTSERWHSRGRPVVYCTTNPSTALLEVLVHFELDVEDRPAEFTLLKIESPEKISTSTFEPAELGEGWQTDLALTCLHGDSWLASSETCLLNVPSVLVPETSNVVLNPAHAEAGQLKIAAVYPRAFDTRLFPG